MWSCHDYEGVHVSLTHTPSVKCKPYYQIQYINVSVYDVISVF